MQRLDISNNKYTACAAILLDRVNVKTGGGGA